MGKKYDQLNIDERYEIGRLMDPSASTIGGDLRQSWLPKGDDTSASADLIALSRRRRSSRIERLSPLR